MSNERVTKKMLQSICDHINTISGAEHTIEDTFGGYRLVIKDGNYDATGSGFVASKPKLEKLMQAYRKGLLLMKDNQSNKELK